MRACCQYAFRTTCGKCLCALAERASRVDNIVDQECRLALNITDEVHDLSTAGTRTPFFDDGNRRTEEVRHDTRTCHPAQIRRDDNEILDVLLTEVIC